MRTLLILFALLAMSAHASAADWTCRYLNFHRGPAPRTLHVDLLCTQAGVPVDDPCYTFRQTKVFRFAPGDTAAERRAAMRQEARRYLRIMVRQTSCAILDNDSDAAVVNADDANP